MDSEIASLQSNGTWQLVDCPADVHPVTVKWVFDIKRDTHGAIIRFKARLVARGFMQQEGIDYNETFAPVGKYSTTRAVLAMSAVNGWHVHQLDVKTAFLQGTLQEEVYVDQPPGYTDGSDRVCRLVKALYGLKQAPRAWHQHMHEQLTKEGFEVSTSDPGLYVCTKLSADGQRIVLLVYVDDMLIACSDLAVLQQVKKLLMSIFDARDLGEVDGFVGMHVQRNWAAGTITISNARMIADLLREYGMEGCNGKEVPMSPGTVLMRDQGDPLDVKRYPYSALVGSLMYLAVTVRPDIAYAVGVLTKYMSCPRTSHWIAAKGVLRYLAGTPTVGITYGGTGSSTEPYGWCDADFAGDKDTRKSTTGFVFCVAGGAVSWSSKRQQTVAASTTEAEYMAASAAAREALWWKKLSYDLGSPVSCVHVGCDNNGALALLHNPVESTRSKHIDVHYHLVRNRVALCEVQFSRVPTEDMVADVLTKPLPAVKHWGFCEMMGVG